MSTVYTDSDVQLVFRALGAEYWTPDEVTETARAILAALAEAGRLVPDGGESITWWGIRRPNGRVETVGAGQGSYELAWLAARRGDGVLVRRDVTDYNGGARLTGPWVEADEDGTP